MEEATQKLLRLALQDLVEALQHQQGLVVSEVASEAASEAVIVVALEEVSEVVIVEVLVEVGAVSDIKEGVALAEEVGMVVGLPIATALPRPMHLLGQVEEVVLVVGMVGPQSMVTQMVDVVVMVVSQGAMTITTGLLTEVEVAGMVEAVAEVSPEVTESR